MVRRLSFIILLLAFACIAAAQDVIVKNDGSTILSKVEEISSTEIKYRRWSNQEGPMYSISRSEVSRINYQNGEVEIMTNETSTAENHANSGDEPVYINGKLDWERYPLHISHNGRKMSDEELRTILGKEAYEDYASAMNLNQIGKSLKFGYYFTGVSGIGCLIAGYSSKKPVLIALGYVGIGIAIPCMIVSVAFENNAEKRIIALVSNYNSYNRHRGSVSFQFQPTIMGFNSQGFTNSTLGLSFSIDF